METKKKLEFYGGTWVSFLPFIIFIAMIIVTTFMWRSISDGALWVPAFTAIIIPFFLAKDKRHYANAVIDGMASREAIIPVVCWIFAGVFSRILRDSGLASGIAGVAASVGVGLPLLQLSPLSVRPYLPRLPAPASARSLPAWACFIRPA